MNINTNFNSPNFSDRILPIKYVIIHYTEMIFDDALLKLTCPKAEVSAHYLIKENGEIFQLVNDAKIAWHAGKSYWQGQANLNQNSIGIELDNLGNNNFSKAQIDSCLNLCKFLKDKYKLETKNFIAHSDIAPDRKIDPGIFFDWQLLASKGFGIWHNYIPKDRHLLYVYGDKGQNIKIIQEKLLKLGYEIKPTAIFDLQTNYIVRSFQAKYYSKLLLHKGLNFYSTKESIYDWCSESDAMLNKLNLLND